MVAFGSRISRGMGADGMGDSDSDSDSDERAMGRCESSAKSVPTSATANVASAAPRECPVNQRRSQVPDRSERHWRSVDRMEE
mmetsp:Transcript_17845/g.36573  ORF Transcript_17845/g.36573 Transcript_17845/m.36573 type:complete len:83 (-) Transcript_17845:685-933(-)